MEIGAWVRRATAVLSVSAALGAGGAIASDYKFVSVKDSIVVAADGSYVETREVVKSPLARSAIDWIGQTDLSYSQNLAELDLLEAYVLKPDDTRIDVPPEAIKLQDDAVSDGAPMFTDEKHKIIVFPQVEIDDRIVYKMRLNQHEPYYPGHYLDMFYFPTDVEVGEARIEISVPESRPLQIEARDFVAEPERREGGRILYAWTYKRAEPADFNSSYAVDRRDFGARLSVSTMRDYGELARAYEARAADKAAVTKEIKALAHSLTAGIDDRREQARKLYDWVNLNIRYVATYIGAGGFVPHRAADVLANRYGDCKDHVVLLEALLAAKGIDSSTAIINSDNSYLLPGVPSLAPFDHAITYLPEFDLYADSTHYLMPFGVIGQRLADKPVIVTKLKDPLRRTPPVDAEKSGSFIRTKARINADGSVTGSGEARFYGPYSDWIRATVADAGDTQLNEWSTTWLNKTGLQGNSTYSADDPFALDQTFEASAEFSTESLLDLTVPGAFIIPESHIGDYGIGDLAKSILESSRDVNVTCGAIGMREETIIDLPAELEIISLPPDVSETHGDLAYTATYKQNGRSITVNREFVDRSAHGQCSPAETREQAAMATAINRDLRRMVLFRPAPGL